jgi:hypothetical protein
MVAEFMVMKMEQLGFIVSSTPAIKKEETPVNKLSQGDSI